MIRSGLCCLVVISSLLASVVFAAETPEVTAAEVKPKPKPYHGSSLLYGHSATAYSFAKGAEPFYNPTWSQRLGLLPEWHFNDQLFVRGRLYLSQELTLSDSTNRAHELELSDLGLDVGAAGFTEPRTKLHVGGDLRFTLPTSKVSHGASRIMTIGPGLNLSRAFEVRSGLKLSYSGRFTYRFNRFSTRQNDGPTIPHCGDARAPECAEFITTGDRTAEYDVTHGPAVSFSPWEPLSIAASYSMAHMFMYRLAPAPEELASAQGLQVPDVGLKHYTIFDLSINWQVVKPVGVSLGMFTYSPQLTPESTRYFPLFNRHTTLYLEASLDIEAAVTGIFGGST